MFVIVNQSGEVQNITPLVTPPELHVFDNDYWNETQVEALNYQVVFNNQNIYILWGSGYSVNGGVGYMVQILNSSGTETAKFTRIIKEDIEVPEDGQSIGKIAYSESEESNYTARGITVDGNLVYVRLKIEDKNYIDVYDGERVYTQKYDTNVSIGDTMLAGPRNSLVYSGRAILTSDTGIHILSLD
jgi:hypothetical protein